MPLVVIDLRTVLGAMLVPPDYRGIMRQSQKLRKSHLMNKILLNFLIRFKSVRMIFIGHIHRKVTRNANRAEAARQLAGMLTNTGIHCDLFMKIIVGLDCGDKYGIHKIFTL